MNSRVIGVTGATGMIGHALCVELASKGFCCREYVRSLTASNPNAYELGNIGIETDWTTALNGVDCVIHCAARVHVLNDQSLDPLAEFRAVNVAGTKRLAEQAANQGVRRFVFVSSIKVNGEITQIGTPFVADQGVLPSDPYGITKWEAEQELWKIGERSGMEIVVVRPPLVYGPGVKANFSTMMHWLKCGLPLPFGCVTNNKRSLVALDNLVNLLLICIDHPAAAKQVFLVSDGEDLSTADLLRQMGIALGKPARMLPVPNQVLRWSAAMLRKGDLTQRLLGSLQVDITKTRNLLNWAPLIGVDEGLRRVVQELRQ